MEEAIRSITTVSYGLRAGDELEYLRADDPFGITDLRLTGNEFNQTIVGNAGDNKLTGGGGADKMLGGWGNDLYYVDNSGDRAMEVAGQGVDTVYTSVSYTLRTTSQVEYLRTADEAGTESINLSGNEFDQTIVGNAGANSLVGGGGADDMLGRLGNDVYYIDNGADRAIEAFGQGLDAVYTTVSYGLRAGSEIEVLRALYSTATTGIHLSGNEFSQSIFGTAGNDVINGGGGPDKMVGDLGNDAYYVDDVADRTIEVAGGGSDTVYASLSYSLRSDAVIETLRTTNDAGTAAINLNGNAFDQTLIGNAGANILNGGAGNDKLVGGGGADTFAFTNLGGADRITDFAQGSDKIDLTALDANSSLAGNQAFTFIGDAAFSHVAGQLRTWTSGTTSYVAGDVDGDGVSDFVINLGGVHVLASDFLL